MDGLRRSSWLDQLVVWGSMQEIWWPVTTYHGQIRWNRIGNFITRLANWIVTASYHGEVSAIRLWSHGAQKNTIPIFCFYLLQSTSCYVRMQIKLNFLIMLNEGYSNNVMDFFQPSAMLYYFLTKHGVKRHAWKWLSAWSKFNPYLIVMSNDAEIS